MTYIWVPSIGLFNLTYRVGKRIKKNVNASRIPVKCINKDVCLLDSRNINLIEQNWFRRRTVKRNAKKAKKKCILYIFFWRNNKRKIFYELSLIEGQIPIKTKISIYSIYQLLYLQRTNKFTNFLWSNNFFL